MTEEEKKAIEYLKDYIKSDLNYFTIDFNNNLRISMNLIEKLQKENEELREITNGYNSLKKDSETFGGIPLIIADEKYFNEGIFITNFIPKDKIREKIKELEEEAEICRKEGCENTEDFDNCCVEILKELLEEE